MKTDNQAVRLKKEILVRLVKSFFSEDFEKNVHYIPYDMRPKGANVPFRCCIYKERAIIKDRLIADLGFAIEEDDERSLLSEYAHKALSRTNNSSKNPLTVLDTACKGCTHSKILVTELCQGCLARSCQSACKFEAIQIINGKSVIDSTKCKNCKMCISACPYNAIVKVSAPCEDFCPVDAIGKDEKGVTKIDFEKCILCGKCIAVCPFAAVHEKSQIIDILKHLKKESKIIAMIAPSIVGQFPGNIYQLKSAMLQIGFSDVFEVAMGADVTIKKEAAELEAKIKSGKKFMTTSCCAAYNELIEKHLPEIKPFVSETKTPLFYTTEIVKEQYPDSIKVFISPCVAKRNEIGKNKDIDYLLNFEELGAIFIAKNIEIEKLKESFFDKESSGNARNFPVSGKVAAAVSKETKNIDAKAFILNNLNKPNISLLKTYAKSGKCNDYNLIEVMCCEGGCINGNSTIAPYKTALKEINKLTNNDK